MAKHSHAQDEGSHFVYKMEVAMPVDALYLSSLNFNLQLI